MTVYPPRVKEGYPRIRAEQSHMHTRMRSSDAGVGNAATSGDVWMVELSSILLMLSLGSLERELRLHLHHISLIILLYV
jgi:hypothetical protein